MTAKGFWEERYTSQARVWSGRPNQVLVSEITDLAPGVALDLGCGEGADAVWLATQGWRVVAVDISDTALHRGAMHAEEAGVADRIEWQVHDLAEWHPDREFDLVSAQFLQSPIAFPREAVLRTAATAVGAGGTLLIVGHAEVPPWAPPHHRPEVHLPTSAEVYESLALSGDDWQIERCEESPRAATGPDGQPAILVDQILRVRRVERRR